jgi:hypothetical protein
MCLFDLLDLNEVKVKTKYASKKQRSKERGVTFELTLEQFRNLYIINNGTCDYTGLPFDLSDPCTQNYYSIERINDKVGYVEGNCCIVSRRANSLKDCLFDKHTKDFSTLKSDNAAVAELLLKNLSVELLQNLKEKYKLSTNTNQERVKMGSVTSESATSVMVNELPCDVHIASCYASWCKSMQNNGLTVELTFNDFKRIWTRKTCVLSGRTLQTEEKDIVIIDTNLPVSKNNICLVDKVVGKDIMVALVKNKMTLKQLADKLKRL